MNKLDLTGNIFGRLTVLGDVRKRTKNGKVLWHCLCECGTVTFVRGDHLKSGKISSCGCLNEEKKHDRFKDLSNTETDNFKIIDRAYSKNQRVYWNCICKNCGNHVELQSNQIDRYSGCGCKQNRSTKERMDEIRDSESLKTDKPTAKSTTGVRGVYFNKRKGSYQAFINVDKKTKYLGSSKNFKTAVALRQKAEKEFWNL
ncbi:AP2 domain-containing protein [Streptococcus gordonii]|uniref:AP2 domain-containing protein n=1 Tax=Streptococcus gordonii TaxID=1302 RepID=UPI0039C406F1